MTSPDGYRIVFQRGVSEDIAVERTLFDGSVKLISKDVIQLLSKDNSKSVMLELEYKDELLTKRNKVDVLTDGVTTINIPSRFYCIMSEYKDEKTRFEGGWDRGKKVGTWHYYSEKGKLLQTVEY